MPPPQERPSLEKARPDSPWRYIQALKRGGWFQSYFEAAGAEGGEEDDS